MGANLFRILRVCIQHCIMRMFRHIQILDSDTAAISIHFKDSLAISSSSAGLTSHSFTTRKLPSPSFTSQVSPPPAHEEDIRTHITEIAVLALAFT